MGGQSHFDDVVDTKVEDEATTKAVAHGGNLSDTLLIETGDDLVYVRPSVGLVVLSQPSRSKLPESLRDKSIQYILLSDAKKIKYLHGRIRGKRISVEVIRDNSLGEYEKL